MDLTKDQEILIKINQALLAKEMRDKLDAKQNIVQAGEYCKDLIRMFGGIYDPTFRRDDRLNATLDTIALAAEKISKLHIYFGGSDITVSFLRTFTSLIDDREHTYLETFYITKDGFGKKYSTSPLYTEYDCDQVHYIVLKEIYYCRHEIQQQLMEKLRIDSNAA